LTHCLDRPKSNVRRTPLIDALSLSRVRRPFNDRMSTMNPIDTVSHRVMIVAGIIMYVLGSIGNILNIWVFAIWSRPSERPHKHWRSVRTSNSSLYLLASSISNLIVIVYPLLTRIMFDGYQYRVTHNNVFILCKLRFYVLHTCDLISLTCICMATFDRYLISSRKVRLRKLSTRRQRTKLIIVFIVLVVGLHGLPLAGFYDISSSGQCAILSRVYLFYYLYVFQIILHGVVPIVFLSTFGILTFQQLNDVASQQRRRHHGRVSSGKQLTRMLLLMSTAIILSSIPYSIEQCLNVLFIDADRSESPRYFLYHVVSHVLYYTNPVSSFYIYYISTPNFRAQIQKILLCRHHVQYVVYYRVKTVTSSQSTTVTM
jgi:hypothetical protein